MVMTLARTAARCRHAVLARSGRWEVSRSGGVGAPHSPCRCRGFRCQVEGRKEGTRERGQGSGGVEIGWGSRREPSEIRAEPAGAEAAAAAAELGSRNRIKSSIPGTRSKPDCDCPYLGLPVLRKQLL
uniref:Uncharacterized protein n=1 Tax=Pipistrellus kuhlii TaxID=59472 RepID=A0A7J7ZJI5_PIPKU|nr:hypothetical protein mPipKuh1_009431 [Pipistrellus kuhlii]